MSNYPKKIKTQVVVVGSGPGGISAAVAAAREGAEVLLIERQGYLGGQLASGLPFLAFYDMYQNRIVGGLAQNFVERLEEINGTAGHRYCPFHLSTTTIHPFYSRIICFQLVKEYGIKLLLHCEPTKVSVEDGKLKSITVMGKGQIFDIEADVFIDGTGDADLAYMAGADYEKGQEETGTIQPPTLMFNLGGVDTDKFIDYIEKHPEELPINNNELHHIQEGYNAEFFRNNPGHIFYGLKATIERLRKENKCPIDRDTLIYIKLPMPGHVAINTIRILDFDGSQVEDMTRGEYEGHLQILPIMNMLKDNVPGFENCYLSFINSTIGVRESRRVMGIRKLTEQDAINGVVPDDTVAIFSYFIDIHSGDGAKTFTQSVIHPYGIPYGCMVSRSIKGLMMTGRAISADAVAFGSSRIMTLCMAVGEAAGIGAALAVKKGIEPADVDPQEVREILRKNGAILEPVEK